MDQNWSGKRIEGVLKEERRDNIYKGLYII